MQYAVIALALAGSALAQLPGVPQCAQAAVAKALADAGNSIPTLCHNTTIQNNLRSALAAACDCADYNSMFPHHWSSRQLTNIAAAVSLAGQFCTNVKVTTSNCAATSTSIATSPATSAPVTTSASVTSAPVSSAPVTSSASSSSVSGAPTSSTNGTVTSAHPSSTSVAVGGGSVAQVGGVAMVGAFLAALAL